MKDFDLTDDHKIIEKIGRRISLLREKRGMSIEELAFGIGISNQLLFDHEIGRIRIAADVLIRIAEVLNLKIINFFPIEDVGEKIGMPFLDYQDCEILEHLSQLRKLSGEELIDRFVKMLISEIKN
ncbi:MAG: XRE family transcriptional regulator [Proteobacteria bacterium]|nr:XRE family transcriptional regulator [Pseudomonadota bacterium]